MNRKVIIDESNGNYMIRFFEEGAVTDQREVARREVPTLGDYIKVIQDFIHFAKIPKTWQ